MLTRLKALPTRTMLIAAAIIMVLAAANLAQRGLESMTGQLLRGSGQSSPALKSAIDPAGRVEGDMAMEESFDDLRTTDIAGSLPPLGDAVIKTGSLTLKVQKNKFGTVYDQVVRLAKNSGGYVAGSNGNSTEDRLVSGTITIRVPSSEFETALSKLRQLGKITSVNIEAQDVSTEFVDLKGRLRHWQAQENILLGLMDQATNIAESITIQTELSRVQMEVERITGRIKYLKDRTDYSALVVTINEPNGIPISVDRWGLTAALDHAIGAFIATISGLIIMAGYLTPLLLVALLVLVFRQGWRKMAAGTHSV